MLAEISTIAIAASTVVATITLIVALLGRRRQIREEAIRRWQRTAIQQILQSASVLSFDDIASLYRNQAVAYRDYNLRGDDLSPQALRLILIEMIRDRIIIQTGGDRYGVLPPASFGLPMVEMGQVLQSMAHVAERMSTEPMKQKLILQTIYETLTDTPHKFSISDLAGDIATELEIEFEEAKMHVIHYVTNKFIAVDDRDKLYWISGRDVEFRKVASANR